MIKNKSLSILLILIFSISLFVSNAFAGGCYGDEDCFKCSQMDHHHAAVPETGFMPYGCQPGIPGSDCGIKASRLFEKPDFLNSAVRVDHSEGSGIAAETAVDHRIDLFSQNIISPAPSALETAIPPIYLSNLSLLC